MKSGNLCIRGDNMRTKIIYWLTALILMVGIFFTIYPVYVMDFRNKLTQYFSEDLSGKTPIILSGTKSADVRVFRIAKGIKIHICNSYKVVKEKIISEQEFTMIDAKTGKKIIHHHVPEGNKIVMSPNIVNHNGNPVMVVSVPLKKERKKE
jgi:hypothetical protein